MILDSPLAKGLSLAASTALIFGAVAVSAPQGAVEIEGSAGAVEARIGSSFTDIAAGVQKAQDTDQMLEPVDVSQSTVAARPTEVTPPIQPVQTPTATAQASATVPPPSQAVPVQAAPPVTPTPDVAPTPVAKTNPVKTLTASAPDNRAPTQSPRPRHRDPVLAAMAAPAKPVTQKAAPEPQKSKQGTARRNNTQGSASGTQTATAKTQGAKSTAQNQSGNSAANNYSGQVMKHISRVPKPRVSIHGVTVVTFSISSAGGLAGVSIARSSGSAALDTAALGVIRKAAPFPAPPSGARRQFSIKIRGS